MYVHMYIVMYIPVYILFVIFVCIYLYEEKCYIYEYNLHAIELRDANNWFWLPNIQVAAAALHE